MCENTQGNDGESKDRLPHQIFLSIYYKPTITKTPCHNALIDKQTHKTGESIYKPKCILKFGM